MVRFGPDQLFDPMEGVATVEDVAICSIIPMTRPLFACTVHISSRPLAVTLAVAVQLQANLTNIELNTTAWLPLATASPTSAHSYLT